MVRSFVLVFVVAGVLGLAALATAQPAAQDLSGCATPGAGTPAADAATPEMASPEASPDATPAACATPGTGAFTVEMVDIAYTTTELTIPAGTDVTIELPNNGAAAHNFNIDELGIHSGDVAPGAATTVTINAPAGTYEYYCSIPGHRQAGMVGTLIVQ